MGGRFPQGIGMARLYDAGILPFLNLRQQGVAPQLLAMIGHMPFRRFGTFAFQLDGMQRLRVQLHDIFQQMLFAVAEKLEGMVRFIQAGFGNLNRLAGVLNALLNQRLKIARVLLAPVFFCSGLQRSAAVNAG